MSLITFDQLKKYLQIEGTDDDFLIDILVSSVQSTVENYCHRIFDITTYVGEQHALNHKLFPRNYPIISVERLARYDGVVGVSPNTNGDGIISGYRIYPSYIDMLDVMYVTMGRKLKYSYTEESYAVIDYTAGFAVTPGDLLLATLKLAALEWLEAREGRLGVDVERQGQVQTTFTKRESEIPVAIAKVLDRYKKVGF